MPNDSGNTTLTQPVNQNDHTAGNSNAPVTLVEYGDYECPACGAAYPNVKEVRGKLGDQVRFVFRNFPLTQMHPYAFQAAETAESAGGQGKFWEMHDFLYEHQQEEAYAQPREDAEKVGLNMSKFEQDMNNHVYAQKIEEDMRSGMENGIPGTPTFFINGQMYNGSYDSQSLLSALQQASNSNQR